MMLKDEVVVIYGAGGAVGTAVARAFARQRPSCSGRNCFAAASVVISEGTHQHAVVDSSFG